MDQQLRGWGAACESSGPAPAAPRLGAVARLELTGMTMIAAALSAVTMAGILVRAPLPTRDVPTIALEPALPSLMTAQPPLAAEAVAERTPIRRRTVPAATTRLVSAHEPIATVVVRKRTRNPLARFLVGDGRLRVQPFPTVTPVAAEDATPRARLDPDR